MDKCCTTGFSWSGTASGQETRLGDYNTYLSGSNPSRAILLCHDAFGWKFDNTRLLADHFAKEVDATVYVPDFFHGNPITEDKVSWVREGGKVLMKQDASFDWANWFSTNGPDIRLPEVIACLKELRTTYSKVGAVGYCWGGSIAFKIASKTYAGLIDCVTIAHPGMPSEDEIKSISVPVQIIAPEHDQMLTEEWRDYCNKEIPKIGVDYHYQYFPDMYHGFATKCDETLETERRALELAKNAVVYWCASHLR